MQKFAFFLFMALIFTSFYNKEGYSATYYIDFDNGNNTSAGATKETAWKSIPGTRDYSGTEWQSNTWGNGTFSETNKVPPGTIFKLKRGSIYDSTDGGFIWIDETYYFNASTINPIIIEADTSWGSGTVTFDGTDVPVGIALILIQVDGVRFDGKVTNGIVIQDSQICGIQVKEKPGTGDTVNNAEFHYIKFYNNGTNFTTGNESYTAQLHIRHAIGLTISHLEIDGNGNHIQGLLLGETHKYVIDATISDTSIHNHNGDDPPNDSGIGFKAFNSKVTYKNCLSYNNLKGWDLGEQNGDDVDISYKVINCTAYNNLWGVNMNSTADSGYGGAVNFYLINSIIRDNSFLGANIYSGPYNLHVVHCAFDNNGAFGETLKYKGNIVVTANHFYDDSLIKAYLYNNIFYKPAGHYNLINQYAVNTNDISLYSDYNAWIQNSSEKCFSWSHFYSPATQYSYGPDGPGHSSGNWYNWYNESTTPIPNGSKGHYTNDANSVGTGANNSTEPPFNDVINHDYKLTENYPGADISGKPWYISEMGIDARGVERSNWDIGAYEFSGGSLLNPPTNVRVE